MRRIVYFKFLYLTKAFLVMFLLELKHEQKQVFLTVFDVLRNRHPPGVLSEQIFSLIVMVKELWHVICKVICLSMNYVIMLFNVLGEFCSCPPVVWVHGSLVPEVSDMYRFCRRLEFLGLLITCYAQRVTVNTWSMFT